MTPAQFQLASKKQLSISDLETIINCIYPGVAPTTYAINRSTINRSGNCVVRCLLKIVKAVTSISYVGQFIYAQPVGRMALFFTLCCHAPLGCRFYKIGTSKRHIKPKYERLNYGQNLLIIKLEIIF